MTTQQTTSADTDLFYAPVPDRPVAYLHPSRMSVGRFAATLCGMAWPRRTLAALTAALSASAGRDRCLPTATGRAALLLALRQAGAGPGTEVVLSTFNCPAVIDAILAAGARPVLVDFDHATGPVFDSVSLDGRLVVLTNGAGLDEWGAHAARVAELGGTIVLDLAQASIAPWVLVRYRGTGCPIVLSFGEGKPLGGIGGGALLTTETVPQPGLRRRGGTAAIRNTVTERMIATAPGFVRAASRRRQAGTPGWSHTRASHLPTESGSIDLAGPSRWEIAVAASMLRTSARSARTSAAIHEAVRAECELSTCELVAADPDLGSGIELVFERPGQRLRFARSLAERGVPSTWNYYPLHKLIPYAEFAAGPMPNAERVWRRVLTVPKQAQRRLTAKLLIDAMRAADREVSRA